MVEKIKFHFEEEDVDYVYEVEAEAYRELLLDKLADYYELDNHSGLRELVDDYIELDELYRRFADSVNKDLESDAYYKFTKDTIDKILYYLPYNKPFNPDTYEKLLGFKVPFEGDIWVTLELKLERNNIKFAVDEDTQTLTIKE